MGYRSLKMKVKDFVQLNVDGYQMTEHLLCNNTGNQANIRFMEFCVNYITFMVVFFYFGCNYLVCSKSLWLIVKKEHKVHKNSLIIVIIILLKFYR